MLSDIIEIGDKVEIRILQEVIRGYEVSEKAHIFKSQLHDIVNEDEIVLAMPMEAAKVILLPMDVRYDITFFTDKGLFNCTGVIKDRYKDGALYEIAMTLTSQLEKYQRRKFFRLECLVDFSYYILRDPEEINMEDPYAAHEYHLRHFPEEERKTGVIVDISGGGIRVITAECIPAETDILLFFQVLMDDNEYSFSSFGHVVKSNLAENSNNRFEGRIEYRKIDKKERERIVKYVFKEEREKRQNQKK
jgi:c-di-GMP-binding flagellar brake protein YcgR